MANATSMPRSLLVEAADGMIAFLPTVVPVPWMLQEQPTLASGADSESSSMKSMIGENQNLKGYSSVFDYMEFGFQIFRKH